MAAGFDPYAVLGVGRSASDAEIRAAYRDLCARYHPDKHAGNPLEGLAAEKMAEINRAYDILSDAKRRATHDVRGNGPRPAGPSGWSATPPAKNSRLVKGLALLLMLPLLIRFGRGLFRLLAVLIRAAFEGLQGMRGTPFALAVVLVVLAVLGVAIFRRRRPKAR